MAITPSIERVPPHNLEAEMAVLGSLLLDNSVSDEVLGVLKADDFYSRANQTLYKVMVELFDARQSVDLVVLRSALEQKKLLEEVGGLAYLTGICEAVPSAANVGQYVQIIRQRSVLRKLISVSNEIQKDAYDATETAEAQVDRAQSLVMQLAQKQKRGAVSVGTVMHAVLERLDKAGKVKGGLLGLESGFYDLDDITSGFQASDLIILAARPSIGKTTLCLNIAAQNAKAKIPVGFLTAEMSGEQLSANVLCHEAQVSGYDLRRGYLSETDHTRVAEGASAISTWPLYITEIGGMSIMQVRAAARRMVSEHGVKLLVVDYLQLVSGSGRRDQNREQEVTEVSHGLKFLAQELEIPLIAVSQLNRAAEGREDHRPRISDLRESGSLEQDADLVLLLHRPDYYQQEKTGTATVIIAKHRNGALGEVELGFRPAHFTFYNLAQGAGERPHWADKG